VYNNYNTHNGVSSDDFADIAWQFIGAAGSGKSSSGNPNAHNGQRASKLQYRSSERERGNAYGMNQRTKTGPPRHSDTAPLPATADEGPSFSSKSQRNAVLEDRNASEDNYKLHRWEAGYSRTSTEQRRTRVLTTLPVSPQESPYPCLTRGKDDRGRRRNDDDDDDDSSSSIEGDGNHALVNGNGPSHKGVSFPDGYPMSQNLGMAAITHSTTTTTTPVQHPSSSSPHHDPVTGGSRCAHRAVHAHTSIAAEKDHQHERVSGGNRSQLMNEGRGCNSTRELMNEGRGVVEVVVTKSEDMYNSNRDNNNERSPMNGVRYGNRGNNNTNSNNNNNNNNRSPNAMHERYNNKRENRSPMHEGKYHKSGDNRSPMHGGMGYSNRDNRSPMSGKRYSNRDNRSPMSGERHSNKRENNRSPMVYEEKYFNNNNNRENRPPNAMDERYNNDRENKRSPNAMDERYGNNRDRSPCMHEGTTYFNNTNRFGMSDSPIGSYSPKMATMNGALHSNDKGRPTLPVAHRPQALMREDEGISVFSRGTNMRYENEDMGPSRKNFEKLPYHGEWMHSGTARNDVVWGVNDDLRFNNSNNRDRSPIINEDMRYMNNSQRDLAVLNVERYNNNFSSRDYNHNTREWAMTLEERVEKNNKDIPRSGVTIPCYNNKDKVMRDHRDQVPVQASSSRTPLADEQLTPPKHKRAKDERLKQQEWGSKRRSSKENRRGSARRSTEGHLYPIASTHAHTPNHHLSIIQSNPLSNPIQLLPPHFHSSRSSEKRKCDPTPYHYYQHHTPAHDKHSVTPERVSVDHKSASASAEAHAHNDDLKSSGRRTQKTTTTTTTRSKSKEEPATISGAPEERGNSRSRTRRCNEWESRGRSNSTKKKTREEEGKNNDGADGGGGRRSRGKTSDDRWSKVDDVDGRRSKKRDSCRRERARSPMLHEWIGLHDCLPSPPNFVRHAHSPDDRSYDQSISPQTTPTSCLSPQRPTTPTSPKTSNTNSSSGGRRRAVETVASPLRDRRTERQSERRNEYDDRRNPSTSPERMTKQEKKNEYEHEHEREREKRKTWRVHGKSRTTEGKTPDRRQEIQELNDTLLIRMRAIGEKFGDRMPIEDCHAEFIELINEVPILRPPPSDQWLTEAIRIFSKKKDYVQPSVFQELLAQYCEARTGRPSALRRSRRRQSIAVAIASQIMTPSHQGARQIYDDYEFREKKGEGSFGEVWCAVHTRTELVRAVKSVKAQTKDELGLIVTEIDLMKSLDHPNVLKLFEYYHDQDKIYLVVEYCQGQSMQKMVHKKCEEKQVKHYIKSILAALAYCHKRHIIHRDIKPENVLLLTDDEMGPVKVIDFGLSDFLERIEKNAMIVIDSEKSRKKGWNLFRNRSLSPTPQTRKIMAKAGTPHYMSPEMHRATYNEKVDVFACGVILYQMLSGIHPFFVPGVDNADTAREKILTKQITFKPLGKGPGADLCRAILEHDVKKRITAEMALSSQWFYDASKRPMMSHSVYDCLRRFQKHNKMKQAVLRLLAKEIDETSLLHMREQFLELDANSDGVITYQELYRSVQNAVGAAVDATELQSIVTSLDADAEGNEGSKINYRDFLSAMLDRNFQPGERHLQGIFERFADTTIPIEEEGVPVEDAEHNTGELMVTRKSLKASLSHQSNRRRSPNNGVGVTTEDLNAIFGNGLDTINFQDFCRMVSG